MRRPLVSLLLLIAIVAAACGGGDGDNAAARSSTTAEKDEGASTSAEGNKSDDTSAGFSGRGSGDFCAKARDYEAKFAKIGQDPSKFKSEWKNLRTAIDDIASEAPREIKADVDVVRKNFDDITTLYEKYDYDFSKIPQEEAKALQSPEGDAANQRLNDYMEQVCKIGADDTVPEAPSESAPETGE